MRGEVVRVVRVSRYPRADLAQDDGADISPPPPGHERRDRLAPEVVAQRLLGIAAAVDVVRELLGAYEVEEGNEPGADRPPWGVAELPKPEPREVRVRAVKPGDERERGQKEITGEQRDRRDR